MNTCMNPHCRTPFCSGCGETIGSRQAFVQDVIRAAVLEARPWITIAELDRIIKKHSRSLL